MSRTWLKVEGAVVRHPKVHAFAAQYGVHPYLVVGFLVAWWDYCAEFASRGQSADCPDGVLTTLAAPILAAARVVTTPPIRDALIACGLADQDGRPHDWQAYTGNLLTQRALDAQRQRLHRELSRGQSADGHAAVTPQSRVEKKRLLDRADSTQGNGSPSRMTEADFLRAVAAKRPAGRGAPRGTP